MTGKRVGLAVGVDGGWHLFCMRSSMNDVFFDSGEYKKENEDNFMLWFYIGNGVMA